MRRSILRWLLVLSWVLACARPALACSCVGFNAEGFIHADVTVLPANAKGALFLTSVDMALTPDMFSVTVGSGTAPARVRIEPVDLPAGHPLLARLRARDRLVRIGIEGGFVAGSRYALRFLPPPHTSARHASTAFRIDAAPFDLLAAPFAVRLDGAARRTVLALEAGGSCGKIEAALVQDFHVQVPDALQAYLPALSLLGEAQDVPGAAFTPVVYRSSLCTPPLLDQPELPHQHDLVHLDCRTPSDGLHIRAWVGMLEVDERVAAAAPATADLGPVRSLSCSPFVMLRQAIERDDAPETAKLACLLGRPGNLKIASLDLGSEGMPAPSQWTNLIGQGTREGAACGMAAMATMLLMAKPGHDEFLATYARLAKHALGGADPAAIAPTLHQLDQVLRTRHTHRTAPQALSAGDEAVLSLLPELLDIALDGGAQAGPALALLRDLGPGARAVAPQLMQLAGQDRPDSAQAVQALERIIPDDPAFQAALPGWAQRPAMGDTPALVYAQVAGARHPAQAVALLVPLLQAGDVFAVDALADLGPAVTPAVTPAVPALLALMAQDEQPYVAGRALRALITVAPDEDAIVAAMVHSLLGPRNHNMGQAPYLGLAHLRAHAGGLVPVVRHLIDTMQWHWERDELRALILAMNLSNAQRQDLLAILAHRQVAG